MQTSSGEIKTREFNKPERVRSPQPQSKQSASFSLPLCVSAGKSSATFIFRWNQVVSVFLTESLPPTAAERHSFHVIKI